MAKAGQDPRAADRTEDRIGLDDPTTEGDDTTSDGDTSTEDEERDGPEVPDVPAPPAETDAGARSDASGRDITPPPRPQPAGQNPGLVTEGDPEDMDFREVDSGARWMGDDPAPDRLERDTRAGATGGRLSFLTAGPDAGTDPPPASTDLIEAVTMAIEETELLDIHNLSVERAGDTIILRGSAGTPEERDRAAEIAAALRGVGRVENLISAA